MAADVPQPSSSAAAAPPLQLAVTDHLSRSLRETHALEQRRAGHAVWRTPRIVSVDQWIADTWADQWPAEQLISTPQALALWLEAIESDRETTVLAPLATAREALRAERLLLNWQMDARKLPARNDEQRAWLHWRRRVRARMRDNGWLLREDLAGRIQAAIEEATLDLPATVQMHGSVAALPPALRAVLDALATRSHLTFAPPPASGAPVARIERLVVADPTRQFRHAAITIRERLAETGDGVAPRIVVVLPDPHGRRELLEAALLEFVAPQPGPASPRLPWRWEAGRPATLWPFIEAAAAVFALDLNGMEMDRVSRFLLAAPLWEAGPARNAAAALDYRLRDAGKPRLRLESLAARADPAIAPQLGRLLESVRAEPRRAPPSVWAQAMEARLAALGWPEESALPSIPFQCLRELRRRLARLGSLDTMVGGIGRARARQWLNELLYAGFEPRVEHIQPVSILAPEDAAGLPCDLMIVCDASADAFPGRTRPTPFLARDAQYAAGVPEAAPDTWLERRRADVAALQAHAAQLQVLVPAIEDSGAQVQPSPLFGERWHNAAEPPATGIAERLAGGPAPVTVPARDPVPAVAPAEAVHGDAQLFTQWAESPFFAFCTHRLGLEPFPQPARGLDARAQGTLIHGALERFWGEVRTREALRALDDPGLNGAIDAALAPLLSRKLSERDFGAVLVKLEGARLHDLLRQWLQHETRRSDAFEVILREQKLQTELAGLPLSLVIDRIDRVDSAKGPRWLVLDYKTGREANPRGWNEDTLRAPQLPLYAILGARLGDAVEQVDGIGFAHLKDGHPALSAATDWCHSLLEADSEPKRDWSQRLAAWAGVLEKAARAFLAGDAAFDPAALRSDGYNTWLLPLAAVPDDSDTMADDA